jgi:hypothetical protein
LWCGEGDVRSAQIAAYVRTLIITATEILINPTNRELVVTFARLLPTVSYTILELVEHEDAA